MDTHTPNGVFSLEFFPPRTPDAKIRLKQTAEQFAELRPDFFSVTYGAGGGTRGFTLESVLEIAPIINAKGLPHLSCVGHSTETIESILKSYMDHQIKHIVALRGDLPSGTAGLGPLRFANELVRFIREKTGDHFSIEVACYPECHPANISPKDNVRYFKDKVDAGATGALTQYFFNPDSYFSFVETCHRSGIQIPIIPGIMPITNCSGLIRFSQNCGAEIPRWLLLQLRDFGDDRASIRSFGVEIVTRLCERLLAGGAPGLHFYTLNHAEETAAIWRNLGLHQR